MSESEDTLKACFLRERTTLLRLLSARLRSVEEAEDVLHDLWVRLTTMEAKSIDHSRSYLFTMANNIATDRRRSMMASKRRELEWIENQGTVNGEVPSAEVILLAIERLNQIDEIISSLPERTAQIFRLYRYDGIPRREIAELLGISISAVEKHLSTAYRALHGLSVLQGEDRRASAARPSR